MKLTILPLICTILAAAAAPAHPQESADTVFTTSKARKVVITDSDQSVTVTVTTPSGEEAAYSRPYPTAPHNLTRTSSWSPLSIGSSSHTTQTSGWRWSRDITLSGISAGFVAAGSGTDVARSFEIGVEQLLGTRFITPWNAAVSIGFGLNWRNIELAHGSRFIADTQGHVTVGAFPQGCAPRGSAIHTFNMQFPILYTQPLGSWCNGKFNPRLTLGVMLNWVTSASLHSSWTNGDGNLVEMSTDGLHQRRFTCDIYSRLDFCRWAGIYVRCSPRAMFSHRYGPDYQPVSFGIALF